MIWMVFIGGGVGACLRYLISLYFKNNSFLPYQTLLANFLGCLLAGLILGYLTIKADINPIYKGLLITGLCGGLTTFSTFSIEVLEFIQTGEYLRALAYILLSLVVCLISAIIGMIIIQKFS